MEKEKILSLIRGVAGSGKSSFSKAMAQNNSCTSCTVTYPVFEADDYFMKTGEYLFDREKLHLAHLECESNTEAAMKEGVEKIFVCNTFTKSKDTKPYKKLAEQYGYKVFSIVVENIHGGKDVHGVPEETLERMEKELRNNLKLR